MPRHRRRRRFPTRVAASLLGLVLIGTAATALSPSAHATRRPGAPASSASSAHARKRPSVPPERATPYWAVVSRSDRGVMVDYRNVTADGVTFRALRLRARTTLLRWHVGAGDPRAWAQVPKDAGPAIDWPVEGPAGVVAVFNGAFKQSAGAGGSMVDGLTLAAPVRGDATLVLNPAGHWAIGTWGSAQFPPAGFDVSTLRQNLVLMVSNARPTPAALSASWKFWGDPLHEVPPEPRSGLGVDAQGNLIYVATMAHVMPASLARAMVAAGIVTGMELDINPYWPILGAPLTPLHHPGPYAVTLPLAQHDPTIYNTGWERDFFVALAEPNQWNCDWTAPGVPAGAGVRAQPLHRVGVGCGAHR